MPQSFLDQVRARQGSLTNAGFARLLGLSPSGWSRVRRGQRGLSHRTQMRILRRMPELIWYVGHDAEGAA